VGEVSLDLSVVLGTYNRLSWLTLCLESIRESVRDLRYEIIIVDGGSTDGTLEFLQKQSDVILIRHTSLLGPGKAYNDGFAKAQGRYVAHLNDDLTLRDDALWMACHVLDEDSGIGQVVIPHWNPGSPGPAVATCLIGQPQRRWIMACFGVTRRELGEAAGWFDGFYHFCGDNHLSMSVWARGYKVVPLQGRWVVHGRAPNALRGTLEEKWKVAPEFRHRAKADDWAHLRELWGNWDGTLIEEA